MARVVRPGCFHPRSLLKVLHGLFEDKTLPVVKVPHYNTGRLTCAAIGIHGKPNIGQIFGISKGVAAIGAPIHQSDPVRNIIYCR